MSSTSAKSHVRLRGGGRYGVTCTPLLPEVVPFDIDANLVLGGEEG